MKLKCKICYLFLFSIVFISCNSEMKYGTPNMDVTTLNTDFFKWYNYQHDSVVLSSEFVPLNDKGSVIDEGTFLKILTTGKFIPIKLKNTPTSKTYYQLFNITNDTIRSYMSRLAEIRLNYFLMENTPFPDFSFTDINGKTYTKASLKGKTIFFKTWFIGCKPCVEEFPILNQLVKNHEGKQDTVFISLALDTKEKLTAFLAEKPFEYTVIPKQKTFINEQLKTNTYPTHILVDKNGIIKKVVNNIEELPIDVSNLEEVKNNKEEKKLPPPPPPPAEGLKK